MSTREELLKLLHGVLDGVDGIESEGAITMANFWDMDVLDKAREIVDDEAEAAAIGIGNATFEIKESYTLRQAADQTRALANQLFKGPCSQKVQCLKAEYDRPFTVVELKYFQLDGTGHKRPTWGIDPSKLCAKCCVYWYAEMAAIEAHKHACLLGGDESWLKK